MRRPRVPLVIVLGVLLGVGAAAARSLGTFQWPGAAALVRCVLADRQSRGVVSDAESKEDLRDLDGDEVLAKIARMPIRQWNYTADDPAIRHLGPTPRDFHAAFGLGADALAIDALDAAGVALRAIQALEARSRTQHENLLEDTQALADQSASLVQENTDRVAQLAALTAEIAALHAEVAVLRQGCR
jgi:hypothetical protein